jgi:hypothetical protein
MFWADLALLGYALGGYFAHRIFESRASRPVERVKINMPITIAIGVICLALGAVFFFTMRAGLIFQEGVKGDAFGGYAQVIAMWPIGSLGLLVFVLGFRWYLLCLIAAYLAYVGLQGYHRFMLILPLVYFTAFYLMSSRRRWPTLKILAAGLVVALVFPRLKYIGRAVQEGDSAGVIALLSESFNLSKDNTNSTISAGEDFLDQYAGALSLIDENDRKLWGSTYLAILTLPIPRAWWTGKPGLADHLTEISNSRRNFGAEGRIITYLGEAYLNFSYAGFLVVPALIGYLLTKWCLYATTGPIPRVGRYVYLVAFMAFIQMYRDGLTSLVLFSLVHNLPMFFVMLAHQAQGAAVKVIDRTPSDPLAEQEEEDIRREEARRLGGPEARWRQ